MIIARTIGLFPATGKDLERKLNAEAFPLVRELRQEINRLYSAPVTLQASATLGHEVMAVLVDASLAAVDVTLPGHATVEGEIYLVRCIDSTNPVNLIGTINGVANLAMVAGDAVILKAGENSWYTW